MFKHWILVALIFTAPSSIALGNITPCDKDETPVCLNKDGSKSEPEMVETDRGDQPYCPDGKMTCESGSVIILDGNPRGKNRSEE